jgi:hypothetical protein
VPPASSRRTIAAMVTVWILGLFLVLGLWQRVDAACDEHATDRPATGCATTPDDVTTVLG